MWQWSNGSNINNSKNNNSNSSSNSKNNSRTLLVLKTKASKHLTGGFWLNFYALLSVCNVGNQVLVNGNPSDDGTGAAAWCSHFKRHVLLCFGKMQSTRIYSPRPKPRRSDNNWHMWVKPSRWRQTSNQFSKFKKKWNIFAYFFFQIGGLGVTNLTFNCLDQTRLIYVSILLATDKWKSVTRMAPSSLFNLDSHLTLLGPSCQLNTRPLSS